MTDKQQPEALRLAELLTADEWPGHMTLVSYARECVAELRRMHAELETLRTGYAAAQQPDIENLRKALQFYADSEHFIKSDGDAWDTVSGEPQNYWCDEAGTATVEDGSIARLALSGQPVQFEDDTPQSEQPGAAYAKLPDESAAFLAWWPSVGQTIGQLAAWLAWQARASHGQAPEQEAPADALAASRASLGQATEDSLVEAINHATEVATRQDQTECGRQHAQLAGWLSELVELRNSVQGDALTQAARDVLAEVERATRKFPTWPTDPLHALAVLGEEFGELTKDMLQLTYEPHKTNAANLRTEALQTAAMALRLFMSLDRYEYRPGAQHSQDAARAAQEGK